MYATSVAFVRRVDHSSFILSCKLIGQRENKSFYVMKIVLRLGYADVIFRRRESRQPEIRLRLQATSCMIYNRTEHFANFTNFGTYACQERVAIITVNSINSDRSHQIVSRPFYFINYFSTQSVYVYLQKKQFCVEIKNSFI